MTDNTRTTQKGYGNSAESIVSVIVPRDDREPTKALQSELNFINAKLERSGLLPAQLVTRKAELEAIIAARSA